MSNVPEKFNFRFLICAVLLVTYIEYASAQKFYVANGTLVYLDQGDDTFFTYSEKLPNKVLTYNEIKSSSLMDDLQLIQVYGFINELPDDDIMGGHEMCSIILSAQTLQTDFNYNLGFITTKFLLPFAYKCNPLPKGSFLLSSGFMRMFKLRDKYKIPCDQPWNYRVLLQHYETRKKILEAVFEMEMRPMYACANV